MSMAGLDAPARRLGLERETAGHPKLDDENPSARELDRHLLSLSVGRDDRISDAKRRRKSGIDATIVCRQFDHATASDAKARDTGADDPRIERSTKVLDFRQFRHGVRVPRGPNPILAGSQRRDCRRSLHARSRFRPSAARLRADPESMVGKFRLEWV